MLKLRMSVFSIIVLSVMMLLETMRPAHAYIEPGTGSYLFQVGVAVVLGGIVIARHHFERFGAIIRRRLMHKHRS